MRAGAAASREEEEEAPTGRMPSLWRTARESSKPWKLQSRMWLFASEAASRRAEERACALEGDMRYWMALALSGVSLAVMVVSRLMRRT